MSILINDQVTHHFRKIKGTVTKICKTKFALDGGKCVWQVKYFEKSNNSAPTVNKFRIDDQVIHRVRKINGTVTKTCKDKFALDGGKCVWQEKYFEKSNKVVHKVRKTKGTTRKTVKEKCALDGGKCVNILENPPSRVHCSRE